MDKELLPNVTVILMQNLDTLEKVQSNEQGEFMFLTEFSAENSYAVTLDVDHQRSKSYWVKIHAKGDTARYLEYRLDLLKLRIIKDRFDNSIYYAMNETNEYENFDLPYFLKILEEYPQMCIKFVQIINPEEDLRIANRRKRHFLKLLKSSGVNMSQLFFSEEILLLDTTNLEDKRSRIEGVVHSMSGSCK